MQRIAGDDGAGPLSTDEFSQRQPIGADVHQHHERVEERVKRTDEEEELVECCKRKLLLLRSLEEDTYL